jgi:hypothetical protein
MFKLRKSKRDARRTIYLSSALQRATILRELRRVCSEDLIKDVKLITCDAKKALSFKNKYRPIISWCVMKCGAEVILVRGGNLLKHETK